MSSTVVKQHQQGEFLEVKSAADRALLLALERAADMLGEKNFAGMVKIVYTKKHDIAFTIMPEQDEPFTTTDLKVFQGLGEDLTIQYQRPVRLLLEPNRVEFFFPMKVAYVQ